MRKRLVLMIIGVGLLATTSALAQQPSNDTQLDNKSAVKPYVVVVFGAVPSPGRFQLLRPIRLSEILKLAGGLTWWADQTIQVIHSQTPTDTQTEAAPQPPSEVHRWDELSRGDEKSNPYLNPGDVVIVTEDLPIYVTGHVVQPGSLPLRHAITLGRAITMAGGPLGHRTGLVRVYRTKSENSPRTVLTFDLQAIQKGRAEDPVLQSYDIIEVFPSRKSRSTYLSPFSDSRPLAIQLPSRVVS
jgi:protein involved in polysaccharide export with SLBB domain